MLTRPANNTSATLERTEERLSKLPILVLNVHSRCNCRCLMCDIWKREETNEITASHLAQHRESLKRLQVEWVVLSGGEPLMNRDLHALCTFLRGLPARITLLTTGLLLTKRAEEVAALFDGVIVSLDGPPEIHDGIRRVKGGFDLIGRGIAAVRRLRPDMPITGRTTVQRLNCAHLRETVSSARALGLNGISFLAADLTSQAFNRPLAWPTDRQSEVGLSREEVEMLEREVQQLIAARCESDDAYVAESPAKLMRIVQHFRAHLGQDHFVAPRCNAPWVSAVIEADGAVRPCFFHHEFGNIQRSTLEEIVNGEKALRFRRELDIQSNPVCRRCVCALHRTDMDHCA